MHHNSRSHCNASKVKRAATSDVEEVINSRLYKIECNTQEGVN